MANKVFVSCTSTSCRLDLLFHTLSSLKRQTLIPDRLFVNLSDEPYLQDAGIKNPPAWLADDAFEVNWVENTGPYRKLLPVLAFVDNSDIIVTADDDVLYHPDWLASLTQISEDNPESIICARAREVKRNWLGGWDSYASWKLIPEKKAGLNLLPIGNDGVLYKKSLVDLDFIYDQKFKEIAPSTDDLWFRMASLRNNTNVMVYPEIGKRNFHIDHQLGLENINLEKRLAERKILVILYRYLKRRILGGFGIAMSENDRAWKRIYQYANRRIA